jgi:protein ImuB
MNDAARASGLSPGMTLSHARALVPDVQTAPADPEGDRATLEKLADWCCRYSPSYGIDDSARGGAGEDHGLWIDSTGCAHLFGGEEAMLADLGQRLDRFGLRHRLGLADTPGAAWALARHHPTTQILSDHESRNALLGLNVHEVLAALPVAGLRLTAETLTLLRRLGLKTVGQLNAIPRAALAKRFTSKEEGEAVQRRLDQLSGGIEEPLTPRRPRPVYRAEQAFLEPLIDAEALTHGLALLAADLCRMLTRANEGAVRLAFLAFRVDGDVKTLRLGVSLPTRDPVHIVRLFRETLEKIDPGFGIEKLALHAEQTAPIERTQGKLEGGGALTSSQDERFAQLIDRLAARLGEDAVTITKPVETHIPEGQGRLVPSLACNEQASGRGASPSTITSWADMPVLDGRPSCLLLEPEPIKALAEVPDGPPLRFTWRRVTHRIVKAEGPDRIAPNWADAVGTADSVDLASETRDYYRVEDEEGRRYWLFRKGLYDSRGYADPDATQQTAAAEHSGQANAAGRVDWFMHGVLG